MLNTKEVSTKLNESWQSSKTIKAGIKICLED